MADWSELKRLAEAATPGPWRIGKANRDESDIRIHGAGDGSIVADVCSDVWDDADANAEFIAAANPAVVLALIAENEKLVERRRLLDLLHGRRATELVEEVLSMRDEVRRLKILAGEDVPPLPEEFVGPMPERPYERLRRKLRDLNDAPKPPASLVFPPIEQQTTAGGAGAAENCRCNEKLQAEQRRAAVLEQNCAEMAVELERVRADAERYAKLRRHAPGFDVVGLHSDSLDAYVDTELPAVERGDS
ncbi:ead/Ea22-like family protein [Azotobacter beijerinckii]|uniref:Ead/Ea22-like protein n=1 Tax=Azotobacter beijerinckii TaxID=170623 RepID=A0A1I0Z382_9GAMM|nr:ead/Ea22-like family protein [Azotobacter beijerinckii]SFB19566.1 Ead/Ea22-like protein [Azotobacter beijerinckii]